MSLFVVQEEEETLSLCVDTLDALIVSLEKNNEGIVTVPASAIRDHIASQEVLTIFVRLLLWLKDENFYRILSFITRIIR